MHELALMDSVVEMVERNRGDARVLTVRLEIGALAGVAIDAMRFCFEVCIKDTELAEATLDIIEIPARARCHTCGLEDAVDSLSSPCDCGSFDRELLSGHELRLKEVEVI